jgi:transcriptional regulator GlxA family with amidase domain
MDRRLERARLLLDKTSMPITEIAFETGFENPGHFSKMFKSRYGISPKQARENSNF